MAWGMGGKLKIIRKFLLEAFLVFTCNLLSSFQENVTHHSISLEKSFASFSPVPISVSSKVALSVTLMMPVPGSVQRIHECPLCVRNETSTNSSNIIKPCSLKARN